MKRLNGGAGSIPKRLGRSVSVIIESSKLPRSKLTEAVAKNAAKRISISSNSIISMVAAIAIVIGSLGMDIEVPQGGCSIYGLRRTDIRRDSVV
jgi:methenyltetrahydromethanopterin cyclohydrolase